MTIAHDCELVAVDHIKPILFDNLIKGGSGNIRVVEFNMMQQSYIAGRCLTAVGSNYV